MPIKINTLAQNKSSKEISKIQPSLDIVIAKDREIVEVGMGVLSDGTPYLNQRGLAALADVQNAHIGSISSQWNDDDEKPRIKAIKAILEKSGKVPKQTHVIINHAGKTHYCYPADVCLAVLEYYAFDAGANISAEDAYSSIRRLVMQNLTVYVFELRSLPNQKP